MSYAINHKRYIWEQHIAVWSVSQVECIMEKEIRRVHKLALPLVVERSGSSIVVSDGIFAKAFEFKEFGRIRVTSIDSEGFVTFEILAPQQEILIEPSLLSRRISDVGFVHIGSGTAKSQSGSTARGTYEYFKRPTDEYYYTIHKLGVKTKRIHLGSLQDQTSHIRQIAKAIETFDDSSWFDRKVLVQKLMPALAHGQKLKSVLDILVLEGFLDRRESHKRGKVHEEYKITSKLRTMR